MTCDYWGLQDQLSGNFGYEDEAQFTKTSILGWSNTTVSALWVHHLDAKMAVNGEKSITNLVAIAARRRNVESPNGCYTNLNLRPPMGGYQKYPSNPSFVFLPF